MSKFDDIAKQIKLDAVSSLNDELRYYAESQPYRVECSECGDELEYNASIDNDDDITVKVCPCKTCAKDTRSQP